eukprot:TRINITY_DN10423_c0_g1_i1.p1 TRINITY_DN10423_c0_g1~~TRINITY_DN10423_c0_g1_i1.p1  ORF type:complete len:176 (+),score=22.45 TRINITY_DN10423_c0_g1_i1:48-575(+)
MLKYLRHETRNKWPDNQNNVTYSVRSGFVFLRLFCPAILNPKLFDLADEMPDPLVSRNLTLVSKVLMSLANLADISQKEPYLLVAKPWIEANTQSMLDYLDAITVVPEKNGTKPYNKEIDSTHWRNGINYTIGMAHVQHLLKENLEHIRVLPTNPVLVRLQHVLRDFDLVFSQNF